MSNKQLSLQEKLFVQKVTDGMAVDQAREESAMPVASMDKKDVKREIELAFERKGLSRDSIAETLHRNMNATVPKYTKDGDFIANVPVPNAQVQAAKVAIEVLGDKAPNETKHTGTFLHALMVDESDEMEEFKRMKAEQANAITV